LKKKQLLKKIYNKMTKKILPSISYK